MWGWGPGIGGVGWDGVDACSSMTFMLLISHCPNIDLTLTLHPSRKMPDSGQTGGLRAFEQITPTRNYLPLRSYFFPVDRTALFI